MVHGWYGRRVELGGACGYGDGDGDDSDADAADAGGRSTLGARWTPKHAHHRFDARRRPGSTARDARVDEYVARQWFAVTDAGIRAVVYADAVTVPLAGVRAVPGPGANDKPDAGAVAARRARVWAERASARSELGSRPIACEVVSRFISCSLRLPFLSFFLSLGMASLTIWIVLAKREQRCEFPAQLESCYRGELGDDGRLGCARAVPRRAAATEGWTVSGHCALVGLAERASALSCYVLRCIRWYMLRASSRGCSTYLK